MAVTVLRLYTFIHVFMGSIFSYKYKNHVPLFWQMMSLKKTTNNGNIYDKRLLFMCIWICCAIMYSLILTAPQRKITPLRLS